MSRSSGSLWILALQKFKKDFWGVSSLCIIVFYAFCAIFAYLIAPDNTQYANQMHISIHSQAPGFTVDMIEMPIYNTLDQGSIWDWYTGSSTTVEEIPFSELKNEDGNIFYRPYDVDGKILPFKLLDYKIAKNVELSRFRESYTAKRTFLLGTVPLPKVCLLPKTTARS